MRASTRIYKSTFATPKIGWRLCDSRRQGKNDWTTAQAALLSNKSLCVDLVAFCIAWGLLLAGGLLFLVLVMEIAKEENIAFIGMKRAMNPTAFFSRKSKLYSNQQRTRTRATSQDELFLQAEHGNASTHTDRQTKRFLKHSPLHVGNAFASEDKENVVFENEESRYRGCWQQAYFTIWSCLINELLWYHPLIQSRI